MTKLAIALVVVAACSKPNPYYCEDGACEPDGGGGGTQACTTSDQCSGGTPVCEPTAQACVACTPSDPGACAGTSAPVCSDENTCRGCIAHSECTISNACLPNGACGDDATVAYVSPSGNDTGPCSKAEPCQRLSVAATKGKPYVKIEADLDEAVSLANVNVTLLANPGTAITRSGSAGPVIDLTGTSNVTLYDLVVRSGLGTGGHGINVGTGTQVMLTTDRVKLVNNGGNGIYMQSGKLEMRRTVVSGNQAGGANLTASFAITNSLFVANGNATVTMGGLKLDPQGTGNVFRFNTVANNMSNDPSASVRGMSCAFPFASASILVAGNQVSPNCTFEYSLFPTNTTLSSSTNKTGEPVFKNTDAANALAPDFYRIDAASAAIDGGEPSSTVMTDIDGDSRPQGGVRDIGADEYK